MLRLAGGFTPTAVPGKHRLGGFLVGSRDSEMDSCTYCEEPGDISPVTRSHGPFVSSLPSPLITVAPIRRGLLMGEKNLVGLVLEVVGS